MTMERKIGEIFEHEGNWYQCVSLDDNTCGQCDMYNYGRCPISVKECFACGRRDKTSVVFRRLEPVGDPYPLYDHIVQRYAGVKFPVALTEKRFINCNEISNTVDIEVK